MSLLPGSICRRLLFESTLGRGVHTKTQYAQRCHRTHCPGSSCNACLLCQRCFIHMLVKRMCSVFPAFGIFPPHYHCLAAGCVHCISIDPNILDVPVASRFHGNRRRNDSCILVGDRMLGNIERRVTGGSGLFACAATTSAATSSDEARIIAESLSPVRPCIFPPVSPRPAFPSEIGAAGVHHPDQGSKSEIGSTDWYSTQRSLARSSLRIGQ
jgi:hypothetical protein